MATDHIATLEEMLVPGQAGWMLPQEQEAIRAAIALMRGQSEVPFGMALVPIEATPEMLARYEYVRSGADWQRHVAPLTKRQLARHRRSYAAMLKVVGYPQPVPTQERDDA